MLETAFLKSPSQPLTRCADRGFTICEHTETPTHIHTFVDVYAHAQE